MGTALPRARVHSVVMPADPPALAPPAPAHRRGRKVRPRFRDASNRTAAKSGPRRKHILLLVGVMSVVLFAASALRHYLFRSGAMDLAFFDQLTWLISRWRTPVSSITGFHLLGDHAAWVMYLIAPLYTIAPDPHVLLAVQAIALAAAAYPLWRLALLEELSAAQALALGLAYLLYPIVLAANVFDFHPEAIAVPALLYAVLSARRERFVPFVVALVLALGTKEVVGLTVTAMGLWLLFSEPRRLYGAVAIVLGFGSFVFATHWIIPHFGGGREASGVRLYTYLGPTVPKIVIALFEHPERWLSHVLRLKVAMYLLTLLVPVCWGLAVRQLWPLIGAAPTLVLNILADSSTGENLLAPMGHYSLVAVPFIALALVGGVASGRCLVTRPRNIVIWSIVLLVLGAGARLAMVQRKQVVNATEVTGAHNRAAMLHAISLVPSEAALLTTHEIAPHLSDRRFVQFVGPVYPVSSVDHFDMVLVNDSHDSIRNAPQLKQHILSDMRSGRFGTFETIFSEGGVTLYRRSGNGWSASGQ